MLHKPPSISKLPWLYTLQKYCMRCARKQDAALATLAVALYAGEGGEERLLAYLATARTPAGAPVYDPHTSLRVCRDANRRQVRPLPPRPACFR